MPLSTVMFYSPLLNVPFCFWICFEPSRDLSSFLACYLTLTFNRCHVLGTVWQLSESILWTGHPAEGSKQHHDVQHHYALSYRQESVPKLEAANSASQPRQPQFYLLSTNFTVVTSSPTPFLLSWEFPESEICVLLISSFNLPVKLSLPVSVFPWI